jgi:NAD-dependent deacetylase
MFSNILVVAGAGISVESGIQPFRGKDGIWEENPLEMATYRKFINEPYALDRKSTRLNSSHR